MTKDDERQSKRGFRVRLEIGKHLMTLGNLAVGSLLFGQAFSGFPFNFRTAALGVAVVTLSYVWAIRLMKGGDR